MDSDLNEALPQAVDVEEKKDDSVPKKSKKQQNRERRAAFFLQHKKEKRKAEKVSVNERGKIPNLLFTI